MSKSISEQQADFRRPRFESMSIATFVSTVFVEERADGPIGRPARLGPGRAVVEIHPHAVQPPTYLFA